MKYTKNYLCIKLVFSTQLYQDARSTKYIKKLHTKVEGKAFLSN